jgi:Flp pilus assembly protein TadG
MKLCAFRRSKSPHKQSGQVILEAALMLPVFVLVAFALIDIQWMVSKSASLEYIVTETARCQAIESLACEPPKSPGSYADTLATNVRMDLSKLTMISSSCNPAISCTVVMSYRYKPLGVWFPTITIQRTGTAAMPGPSGGGGGGGGG